MKYIEKTRKQFRHGVMTITLGFGVDCYVELFCNNRQWIVSCNGAVDTMTRDFNKALSRFNQSANENNLTYILKG